MVPSRAANVTLRQMRAFVAAARAGSVTRAAEHLHLTPSALSMLIRSLEAELAVRLFDRLSRRIELTEAGRALLPALEAVFENLDAAFDQVRRLTAHRRGRLAVATSPLLAAELMPRLIATFQAQFPAISVVLSDLAVDAIAEAVRAGRVDVGICTADADVAGLDVRPLHQDRMLLACPATHPWARRRALRWRDIVAEPLVLMRAGSGLRALVDQTFAGLLESVAPAHEVAQVATAVGLVEAGFGMAILPSYALSRARNSSVASIALIEPVVHREIVALLPAGREPVGACEAFLAHVRQGMSEDDVLPTATPQKRPRKTRSG